MDKTIPMDAALPPVEGTFLGHPRGLFFLFMTEAWERFSFYGMRTLLILFMVQELLLPGRIEQVAGMGAFRSALEWVFGPMSTQAFASQTFGLYAGFVYFTPLFGGLLADRWLGARRVVMIGIVLMTLGHFAMVFDWSFLIALLLLVLGSGCLKGNIAAQVGHLYPPDDEARRSRGFTIFSTGINIGSVLGPFVCGLLAQIYGWQVGFGTAGVMMLVAAVVYFAGSKHLPDDRPRARRHAAAPIGPPERRMMGLVVLVMVIALFVSLGYDQMSNAGLIWVAERVDLATPFGPVPVPWFGSEDPLASIIIVPFLLGLWQAQARRGKEPGDLGKIAISGVIMAASCLTLALGGLVAGEGKVSIVFPVIAYFLSGVAFMWFWPILLALVSRRAPAGINALMMAAVYFIAFGSGVGSGYVAQYYERMPDWQFWVLNAGLSFGTTVLVLLAGPWLKRQMDALDSESEAVRAANLTPAG
jgi:POT family proton-dependent oligopeptide transporter